MTFPSLFVLQCIGEKAVPLQRQKFAASKMTLRFWHHLGIAQASLALLSVRTELHPKKRNNKSKTDMKTIYDVFKQQVTAQTDAVAVMDEKNA